MLKTLLYHSFSCFVSFSFWVFLGFFWFFLFFLIYLFIHFNSGLYYTNFNQTAELVISTQILTTEAKAEIEIPPVKIEAKMSKYSTKFLQVFCAFYRLTHYVLFLLKNNFLFHLNLKSRLVFFPTIFLIFNQPIIFNVSIDSSSLNSFLRLLPHLLQMIKITNVL